MVLALTPGPVVVCGHATHVSVGWFAWAVGRRGVMSGVTFWSSEGITWTRCWPFTNKAALALRAAHALAD